MNYCNGDVYKGEWLNGMAHGYGVYTQTNGYKYEGDWVYNQKDGQGHETIPG